mgnify:CR=1 FL=1
MIGLPVGILVSSTIFCIDGLGSLVIKLTTTITTKQIGAPIKPNLK